MTPKTFFFHKRSCPILKVRSCVDRKKRKKKKPHSTATAHLLLIHYLNVSGVELYVVKKKVFYLIFLKSRLLLVSFYFLQGVNVPLFSLVWPCFVMICIFVIVYAVTNGSKMLLFLYWPSLHICKLAVTQSRRFGE